MAEKLEKVGYALVDATFNALAIFTLTLGGLIVTSSNISALQLEPAMVTAFGVALIRFSLRLYKLEGVNLQGLDELPGVPSVDDDTKNFRKTLEVNVLNVCSF